MNGTQKQFSLSRAASKKRIPLSFAVILLVVLISILGTIIFSPPAKTEQETTTRLSGREQNETTTRQAASKQESASSQPISGVIIAVPGKWQEVVCLDGSKHIDFSILVDNVHWLVRLDRDDNRVYNMYPRNWKPGSHLEMTNSANIVEFSIKPGQAVEKAPIAWSINNNRH